MYVMHKRARVAMQKDGTTRETHSAETRTFTTAMGMLRHCLRERVFEHRTGGVPYPSTPDGVYLGLPGRPSYGLVDPLTRWEVTYDHIEAMRSAQIAFGERLYYWREVEPEWQPDTSVSATGEVHYADNSVELHEIDKRGRKRHRMVKYPSGDACF